MERQSDRDEAFTRLVTTRWAALLRTAVLLTGDRGRAEDLVQAALVKAYPAWGRVRDPEALEAYVRRTMVTTYTSWWRRHRDREASVASPPERLGRDEAAGVDTRTDVLRALARLPRGQRAVVVLRFFDDLTEAQTAQALGCSVGTVKSQTHRALATLRLSGTLTEAVTE